MVELMPAAPDAVAGKPDPENGNALRVELVILKDGPKVQFSIKRIGKIVAFLRRHSDGS